MFDRVRGTAALLAAVALAASVITGSESPTADGAVPSSGCGIAGQHRVCAYATATGFIVTDAGDRPSTSVLPVTIDPTVQGQKEVSYQAVETNSNGYVSFQIPAPAGTYYVILNSTPIGGYSTANVPSVHLTIPGGYSGPTGLPLAVDQTPASVGLLEVASDGGVFCFGGAPFKGSMGGKPLNKPMVGAAGAAVGGGYWLVASDGGIFTFGDAHYYGSTGAMRLNRPIVGMAATPTGHGYWLVASDGGIFSFGDAHYYGSTANVTLTRPVVGIAASFTGHGYWLVATGGAVFHYGDASNYGSGDHYSTVPPAPGSGATPPLLVPFSSITRVDPTGYALAFSNGIGYSEFDTNSQYGGQAYGAMLGAPTYPIVGITTASG